MEVIDSSLLEHAWRGMLVGTLTVTGRSILQQLVHVHLVMSPFHGLLVILSVRSVERASFTVRCLKMSRNVYGNYVVSTS